jgi:hypothetical protein
LDLANVYQLEELDKILPKNKKCPTFTLKISNSLFVIRRKKVPEIEIIFRSSSFPLNLSPRISQLYHPIRLRVNF